MNVTSTGSRPMKGPANSVALDGEWPEGLEKARLYEQILLDIISGDLPPQTPLDERAIAARYAGGVAGVREALGRLAMEGLVLRRPRVGTIVAPMDIGEVEQAFEVRSLLEGRTAALAARKAAPSDVAGIMAAFDGAEEAIAAADFRTMLIMDRRFHRAVARATGNAPLARFVVSLQNIATRFWILEMEKQSPEAQLRDVLLHRALAQAIADHDPDGAEAAAAKLVGDPPSAYP